MITLFTIIYIIGICINWRYFSIAYSKNGIYSHDEIGFIELLLTFIPILNILFSLLSWTFHYPKYRENIKKSNFYNNFFKINKYYD